MNSFPNTALPYAETHYKFKLPWSPLFRRWPEVFVDGPSFAVPGVIPQFYLVVKDADYFPVTVKEVEIVLQPSGRASQAGATQKFYLNLPARRNLDAFPLPINFRGCSGRVQLNARIVCEDAAGRRRTFLNHNYPPPPPPLLVDFLAEALPYPEGWHAGEMHCHSDFSNDPVEFGAPLEVLQAAGRSLGLGFVLCTDHSYDFYYRKDRYMEATDPEANFQAYREQALELNRAAGPADPVVIPGEEVSCGNARGENVHLLVAGHGEFLPGLGDGGRRWFNNKPDLPVAAVLERLGDTPSFAAHPRARVGALERLVFRRGMWHAEDLIAGAQARAAGAREAGVSGLQFWNGHTGRDFREGRAFWVRELLAGKRLLPIAANDAHGDLNRNIGVKTPLFSLYQARTHVFGHVRTVVRAPEKTLAGIQAGLRAGTLCCTDGPFLELAVEAGAARVDAASTGDFGGLRRVSVFAGRRGQGREDVVADWTWDKGPLRIRETAPLPAEAAYVRAEARTAQDRLAISSPVFLQ